MYLSVLSEVSRDACIRTHIDNSLQRIAVLISKPHASIVSSNRAISSDNEMSVSMDWLHEAQLKTTSSYPSVSPEFD